MVCDGHSIPFEPILHVVRRNTRFNIATSTNFWTRCVPIAEKYFKDCKLTVEEKEKNSIVSASVMSGETEGVFTFCAKAAFNRFRALERATGKNFYEVPFSTEAVLQGFESVNTEGVFDFENAFIKKLLLGVVSVRFYDLMVISGLGHGTHTWTENGEVLVQKGHSMREIIAYRDDVFTLIRSKLMSCGIADVGLAFVVMEQAYLGRYAQKGMPKNIRVSLEAIGVEDWLIESIGKMLYLFPKAQGATYVRLAATLMWYKLNYPKEFKEIML